MKAALYNMVRSERSQLTVMTYCYMFKQTIWLQLSLTLIGSRAGTLSLQPPALPSELSSLDKKARLYTSLLQLIFKIFFQNRMLTEEVGRKSQLITALEQDKRSLIRQLFTQTASHGGSTDTIKSGASFRQNFTQPQNNFTTTTTAASQVPQPMKSSSLSKTGHLDIKKLC